MQRASQPIRCLLFDMDGVLVDVSRSYRRAIIDTAAHFLGTTLPPSTVQDYKNRGGFNDDWELTHAIITDRGRAAAFDEVVAVFQDYYRGRRFDGYITDESPLIDPITLHGLGTLATLGIVTGRPEAEAAWTVSHFGWDEAFQVLLAKEGQDGKTKPDPYPLRRALALLAVGGRSHTTDETGYVGDTVDDMAAAVAANMLPIGFVPPYLESKEHGETLRRAGAGLVLTDLSELTGLLAT